MDNKTYQDHFFPFLLKIAAVQVKYSQNQPLSDEETKLVKIISFLPNIIERFTSNPEFDLDDVVELPMANINAHNETTFINSPPIVHQPVKEYTFDDFNPSNVSEEYMEQLKKFLDDSEVDLTNRLNRRPYSVIPL